MRVLNVHAACDPANRPADQTDMCAAICAAVHTTIATDRKIGAE